MHTNGLMAAQMQHKLYFWSFFSLRGPGRGGCGLRSIFTFSLLLVKENDSYQELFFGMKKYFYHPKLFHFEISKIHLVQLHSKSMLETCWLKQLGSFLSLNRGEVAQWLAPRI